MKTVAILVFINILIGSEGEEMDFYSPGYIGYGYFENIGIPEAKRLQKAAKEKEYNSMLRIAGGETAELGEFIYQAGLIISLFDIENDGVCGGSLISEQRVLTAAHCWNDGIRQGYSMRVVLGTTNVYSNDGVQQDTFFVRMHPSYIPSTGDNNIAIAYLPEVVTFTNNIGPIALPSETDLEQTFDGYEVVATGFGIPSDNSSTSDSFNLKQLNLTVITNEVCSEIRNETVLSTVLCASTTDADSNVCGGDSGGPLVAIGSENIRIQIGIITYGTLTENDCQSNNLATFTRVTSFMDWINESL